MAGFDAKRAVQRLDYDFTAFVPGAKGYIPEPTPEEFRAFRERLADAAPEQAEDVGRMSLADQEALDETTLDAVAELCKGYPTRDQIAALPFRVQTAFLAWLLESFADPTGTGATRR